MTMAASAQSLLNSGLSNKNQFTYNPAYAGSAGRLFMAIQASNYMGSVSSAPRFGLFSIHGLLFDNVGFGGNVMVTQSGLLTNTTAEVAGSYRAAFTADHSITFGLNMGMFRSNLNGNSAAYNQYVNTDDPLLADGYYDNTVFKTGFGFVYRYKNLEFSNSLPNFQQGTRIKPELVSYLAYSYFTTDNLWMIKPSVSFFTPDQSKELFNINLQGQWNEKVWLQAGYVTNGNVNFGIGFNLDFISVGYSYGYPTGSLGSITNSLQEVLVTFAFGKKDYSHNQDIYGSRFGNKHVKFKPSGKRKDSFANYRTLENEYRSLKDSLKDQESAAIQQKLDALNDQMLSLQDRLEAVHQESDLESFGERMKDGYYVVVSTCDNLKCALGEQKIMLENGTETEIAFNPAKKFYYVFTNKIDEFDKSLTVMEAMRAKGHDDAWVLVYRKD